MTYRQMYHVDQGVAIRQGRSPLLCARVRACPPDSPGAFVQSDLPPAARTGDSAAGGGLYT
jgi:hypothetical protein